MNNDTAKVEPYEMWRPRLVFDIAPSKKYWSSFYDVSLKNAGGSPTYNITCIFDPDLLYGDNSSLSALPIFKNLHHLIQGEEITFYFGNAQKFLYDDNFRKQTDVTMSYEDAQRRPLSDTSKVDLEKYKGILYIENKDINDIVSGLAKIERTLSWIRRDRLIVKTAADVQKEMDKHKQDIEKHK